MANNRAKPQKNIPGTTSTCFPFFIEMICLSLFYVVLCVPKNMEICLPRSEASRSSWKTGEDATLLKLLYLKSVEDFLELPTILSSPSCQKSVEILATQRTFASPFSLKWYGSRVILSVDTVEVSASLIMEVPLRLREFNGMTPCSIWKREVTLRVNCCEVWGTVPTQFTPTFLLFQFICKYKIPIHASWSLLLPIMFLLWMNKWLTQILQFSIAVNQPDLQYF